MSDSASPAFDLGDLTVTVGLPPNIDAIDAVFDVRAKLRRGHGILFTYGPMIYNPLGDKFGKPLLIHEATHMQQQAAITPEAWWDRYLSTKSFRLEQEIEAHRNEYRQSIHDQPCRHTRRRALTLIARRLSGPLYRGMISLDQAKREIADTRADA